VKTLVLAVSILAVAGLAGAGEPDRTDRTAIVSGAVVKAVDGSVAMTTTNFGGTPLDERIQGTGADGATAGDSGAATGATGATGGTSR
jgi:hypothetical protein